MSGSEPTLEVWLASEAAAHRAMHDVIAIYTDSYIHVLEPAGWEDSGPVDAVLAAAGFRAGSGSGLSVREVACDVPILRLRGFSAPLSLLPKIQSVIARALTGQLNGYFPVVAGQAFFHRSAVAFEYAWAAAGRPPVRLRQPELVAGQRAEDGTPGPIDRAAAADPRVAAARVRPGPEEPGDETPDPWTRGPIEGEDPGPEELCFEEISV